MMRVFGFSECASGGSCNRLQVAVEANECLFQYVEDKRMAQESKT